MSDMFTNEGEAILHLNKVIYESGVLPIEKIFFTNANREFIVSADDWLMVHYRLGMRGVCQFQRKHSVSRGNIDMLLTHFVRKNTGVGEVLRVYNHIADIFKFGWAYKSMRYTTQRQFQMDVPPIYDELTHTHNTAIMLFGFELDTVDKYN